MYNSTIRRLHSHDCHVTQHKPHESFTCATFYSTGFNAKRVDLDDFDPTLLENARLTVFLMATYGEGESTDNATNFNNWMLNHADEDRSKILKDISFTVFGLGNRQYEHFNRMGKRTDEVLHNYGAKRIFDYGEGDDDGSLEEDYEKWKTGLWPSLIKQYHPNGAAGGDDQSLDEEKKVQLSFRLAPANGSTVTHAPKMHHLKPFFQAKVVRQLHHAMENNVLFCTMIVRSINLFLLHYILKYPSRHQSLQTGN